MPDSKLERLYRETDWMQLTEDHPEKLSIKGFEVPYAVFENGDDVTTAQGAALGERLESTLNTLWQRCQS